MLTKSQAKRGLFNPLKIYVFKNHIDLLFTICTYKYTSAYTSLKYIWLYKTELSNPNNFHFSDH